MVHMQKLLKVTISSINNSFFYDGLKKDGSDRINEQYYPTSLLDVKNKREVSGWKTVERFIILIIKYFSYISHKKMACWYENKRTLVTLLFIIVLFSIHILRIVPGTIARSVIIYFLYFLL